MSTAIAVSSEKCDSLLPDPSFCEAFIEQFDNTIIEAAPGGLRENRKSRRILSRPRAKMTQATMQQRLAASKGRLEQEESEVTERTKTSLHAWRDRELKQKATPNEGRR
jgi:hypothetical protein